MASEPKRTITIHFRATRREHRQLTELAKLEGRSPSDVLRRLIAEASARVRTEPQAPLPVSKES